MLKKFGLENVSKEDLYEENLRLLRQLEYVTQEKSDLELLLQTTTAHATEVENELEEKNQEIEGYIRLLRNELEIGRQIQADFLPQAVPEVVGWHFEASFEPAREVAGDFYDIFALPGERVGFVVADVCDKGVGAALFMALTRSLVRVLAMQKNQLYNNLEPDRARLLVELPPARPGQPSLILPADTYEVLNSIGYVSDYITTNHSRTNMFATLFFGVLDTRSGQLYYINAGHDAPVHLGPAGIKGRLGMTGPAVGVVPNVKYKIRQTQLEPDDLLLLYTDGITEAKDLDHNLFTEKRLLARLEQLRAETSFQANQLINSIKLELARHVAGADPSDDITIMVLANLAG
jgi:sigma-B regulation protein RsbU (phosphoserine phosphatase)